MKKLTILSMLLLSAASLGAAEFSELRTQKSRVFSEGESITGIIVSNCTSANNELNPNTDWNKIDYSASNRTAYIEALDGSCGFRLVFESQYFNKYTRGTKVKINLAGCELEYGKDPERYTIKNLTSSMVEVLESNSALPRKEKFISELKDGDIYTFVSLKDVEFLCKGGSFSNICENFVCETPINRTVVDNHYHIGDGWAQLLEDSKGSSIYMQVNSRCQWRRNNMGAPKGTGVVNGVIVTGDNRRYGGSFGKYSIRPSDRGDIDIPMEESSSFRTIAAWTWDKVYDYKLRKDETGAVPAETGSGRLYSDSDCTTGLGYDYNARWCLDSEGSGARKYGALKFTGKTSKWLRPDGKSSIMIETSTAGISGNGLIFNFSICAGDATSRTASGVPAQWTVEYSTDSTKFRKTDFLTCLRPMCWAGASSNAGPVNPMYDCSLGFSEYSIILPSSLLGQEKLYIRIIPASDMVTLFSAIPSDSINKGKFTGEYDYNQVIKIGMVALKTF